MYYFITLDGLVVSLFYSFSSHKYNILFSLFICYCACAAAAMFNTVRDSTTHTYLFGLRNTAEPQGPTEAVGWAFSSTWVVFAMMYNQRVENTSKNITISIRFKDYSTQ